MLTHEQESFSAWYFNACQSLGSKLVPKQTAQYQSVN